MVKNEANRKRYCSIISVKKAFEHVSGKRGKRLVVAGRVIGKYDNTIVLQDESGRIDVDCEMLKTCVKVGDIAEVLVSFCGTSFEGGERGACGEKGGGGMEACGVKGGGGKSGANCGKRVANYRQNIIGKNDACQIYVAEGLKVLTECRTDFFIGKNSPNYKRMTIDRTRLETMKKREAIIDAIRSYFKGIGFMEVETPSLVRLPGMEPYLDVFKTRFLPQNVKRDGEDMYLITSPEYAMKKLLAGGCEKIFQICKCFRNKETDSQLHNPEFTMLEWYRAFADYTDIMRDTEELVRNLAEKVNGSQIIEFGECRVDLAEPWQKLKVKDAFKQFAGIDYLEFENEGKLITRAKEKGYKLVDNSTYDDAFFMIFLNEIEPFLGLEKPVILYEYPASMGALARKCDGNPLYAERFEVFIAGVELCNAFSELTDPMEQRARLEEERKQRKIFGKDIYGVDQSFIGALEFGMPPSGGQALGVDRLVMLLTGIADIKDVVFFPHSEA